MPSRIKPWQLGVVLALVCALAVAVLEWRSISHPYDAPRLLGALPLQGAIKGYLDVGALRSSGVLEELVGKTASEDADYRDFAQQIGFDYRKDLDAIAVAYSNGGLYATLRGRFNWPKLSAYALAQHGQCTKGICFMPASRPRQTISYELLRDDVLGWAVTEGPLGVNDIGFGKADAQNGSGKSESMGAPGAVLWMAAPGSAFRDPSALPAGTRAFFAPLAASQDASFSLQPARNASGGPDQNGKFEIRMQVACASPEIAQQLAGVLTQTTDLLSQMIVRDKLSIDQGSLSSVLVSGRFEARAAKVTGAWPMDRRVIETLLSGEIK